MERFGDIEKDNLKTAVKRLIYFMCKAGFPLAEFFGTNGLFSPLIHHINYLAEVVPKKKVETLSTFEKRKNLLIIALPKTCNMTQTNMISFKKTHVIENNSYNKPFTIRIEQILRCSLKTT